MWLCFTWSESSSPHRVLTRVHAPQPSPGQDPDPLPNYHSVWGHSPWLALQATAIPSSSLQMALSLFKLPEPFENQVKGDKLFLVILLRLASEPPLRPVSQEMWDTSACFLPWLFPTADVLLP